MASLDVGFWLGRLETGTLAQVPGPMTAGMIVFIDLAVALFALVRGRDSTPDAGTVEPLSRLVLVL